MIHGIDILGALAEPLRALVDPAERIYWVFLVTAALMPLLVLGLRRGARALVDGLFRRAIWRDPSSHADVTLVFAKSILAAFTKIPWLAATTGAALQVGLALRDWLGPVDPSAWSRAAVTTLFSAVLFVAWDLSRFLTHLAMHRVRFLWTFHQVHHSARVLTPLTLYRTHPVETMLMDLRGLVTTAAVTGVFLYLFPGALRAGEILGVGALGLVFNAAGGNLRHSHVWLRFGWLERWFISPAQHQLHHARDEALQGRNLGTALAIWDRLAHTWQPAPMDPPTAYGLDDANHDADGALSMLLGPFAALVGRPARAVAAASGGVVLLAGDVATAAPSRAAPPPEAVSWPAESEPTIAPQPDPAPQPEPAPRDPRLPVAPTITPPPPEPAPLETTEGAPQSDVRTVVVGSMFDGSTVPRVAGSAHVVDETELTRREYDDVHRILASVPGVYVRGEDGYGLRPNIGLRGANPDRSAKVNLMEDGVLLGPAPYSAPAAYYFPLATRLTAMEVFKGPASIKYGPNTIGGAINLRTRDIPTTHSSVIDLAGGRYGYFKGHGFYGTTYKRFGVLLEVARIQTQGFKQLDGGGDTGFGKNDAMLKLAYETAPGQATRHRIEAKGGYATEDSDETYLGLTMEDFEQTPNRRYAASAKDNMKWWRSQAELAYELEQGDAIAFEVRAYRHDFDRVWRRLDAFRGGPSLSDVLANPDVGQAAVFASILRGEQDALLPDQALLVTNNDRRFVSQGVQSTFHWRPRWEIVEQDLEIGARLHNDTAIRHHAEDAFLMTRGTLVPEGTDRVDTTRFRGDTVAGSFYAFDAVTLWKRLTVAPGVRVELIGSRSDDQLAEERTRRFDAAVTPGVGALVMATPWLGIFAGAHRGFSPVVPGQPEAVKPEFSMNYELGARANRRGFSGEAVGFASDYSNLNGVCTFSSGCIDGDGDAQYSAGRALIAGVESIARWRHTFRRGLRLELGARYTFTHAEFRDAFDSAFPQWGSVERGFELPYVPKHVVGGMVAFGGERWEVSAAPNYNGAMRDVAGAGPIPDDERINGFFVLDLSAEARVLEHLRIYAQVANATNAAYVASLRPFGVRPGAPLTFTFGVKAYIM